MFNTTHFPKALKYWHEGKFYEWSEAHVHPMVHALHYGSSVFEGIRAYSTAKGTSIFRLKEHLDRFLYSASVAKMDVPYTREDITQVIKLTLKENRLESAYIRPLLFFSYGNLGLVPKFCPIELVVGTWGVGRLSRREIRQRCLCVHRPLATSPSQPVGHESQVRGGLHSVDHLRTGDAGRRLR